MISTKMLIASIAMLPAVAFAQDANPFAPSKAMLKPDPTLLLDCNTAIRNGTMPLERAGKLTMSYGMMKYVPTMIGLSADAPAALSVEPAYTGTVQYGKVTLGPKGSARDHWLAIETLPDEQAQIHFDRNGNGDLTDDGTTDWDNRNVSEDRPASFSVNRICEVAHRGADGHTHTSKYGLNFYWSMGSERAGAYGSGATRGEIEIGGEKLPVAMIDPSNSGDFFTGFPLEGGYAESTRSEKLLWIMIGGKTYDARGTVNHNGMNYVPRTSTDGTKLVLEPSPRIIAVPLNKQQKEVETKKLLGKGEKAPMFEAVTVNGESFSFADVVGEKVVVLDFWATWCGPCVKAMPHLADIKRKAGGEPFEVVAVNVSDNETAFKKYAQAHEAEYGFPLVRDPVGRSDKHQAIQSKHYGVRALPTTFVIDKNGVIQATFTGFRDEGKPLMAELEKLGVTFTD